MASDKIPQRIAGDDKLLIRVIQKPAVQEAKILFVFEHPDKQILIGPSAIPASPK
jgi:hypothetical protein